VVLLVGVINCPVSLPLTIGFSANSKIFGKRPEPLMLSLSILISQYVN